MPLFKRFVQIGRVVVLNRGSYANKMATIINIADQNRILIDGPTSGVPRHTVPLKWVYLTDIVVKALPVASRQKTLLKFLKDQKVEDTWAQSQWAKGIENAKKRATTTDFDRFKIGQARKVRSHLIRNKLAKLRTEHNKKVIGEKKFNLVLENGQWK